SRRVASPIAVSSQEQTASADRSRVGPASDRRSQLPTADCKSTLARANSSGEHLVTQRIEVPGQRPHDRRIMLLEERQVGATARLQPPGLTRPASRRTSVSDDGEGPHRHGEQAKYATALCTGGTAPGSGRSWYPRLTCRRWPTEQWDAIPIS